MQSNTKTTKIVMISAIYLCIFLIHVQCLPRNNENNNYRRFNRNERNEDESVEQEERPRSPISRQILFFPMNPSSPKSSNSIPFFA
uniref:Uncharacterized protein n=1 Tax=Trichobilharzia regenti TaxID=157069 RepID=A0AA85KG00_TRIRE|nr:unnamed protein product [Trichobilharzia regenti]